MPGIGIGISPFLNRKTGIDYSSYWKTLISATVENAAPTHVVLTFPTAQPSLVASDFTIAGFTISSASWTDAVLTLVLSTSVVYGDTLVVTFTKTSETANVTNNVAQTIPQDGLQLWYKFDEGSGTSAVDSSGNSHTGTISGATYGTAKTGTYSLTFDGNDEVAVGTPITFAAKAAFSVGFWVKKTSAADLATIIGCDDAVSSAIRVGSDYSITFRVNGSSTLVTAAGALVINEWAHIIITRDSGAVGTLKCYKNGVDITNGSPGNGNQFVVSSVGSADNSRYWVGSIDNVVVYNHVLSAGEIAVLYGYDI